MKPTIRNKLIFGFAGVIALLATVSGIAAYAVFSLRHSAHEATTVGGQLNSIALEVQVHNLEAQRRVRSFLDQAPIIGVEKAKAAYLEEANFEISEMRGLAERAAHIAPSGERRARFTKVVDGIDQYESALQKLVDSTTTPPGRDAALQTYNDAAERLHEHAEDGEVTGREASLLSLEEIERTSTRSVALVVAFSVCGLIAGAIVGIMLFRAILNPVDHLKSVAENVSLGNLDVAVKRYSEDEIGDLADSFSRMVTAVKFFRLEALEAASAEASGDNLTRGPHK
jgi:HAMP domain-containing protein